MEHECLEQDLHLWLQLIVIVIVIDSVILLLVFVSSAGSTGCTPWFLSVLNSISVTLKF